MDLRLLVAVAVALLLLFLAGGALMKKPVIVEEPPSAAPEILSIQFPKEFAADGSEAHGTLTFQDPNGDIVDARFEVVEAVLFEPFHFDPEVQNQVKGEFSFYLFTVIPQEVTLRVILVDQAGHESQPVEFHFQATESTP